MVSKWGQSRIIALLVWGAVLSFLAAAAEVCHILFDNEAVALFAGYAAAVLALIAFVLDIAAIAADKKERGIAAEEFDRLKCSAFLSFDEKRGRASISGAFSELTGIEAGARVIGRDKYYSIMENIISSRHSTENDIYMSAAADKWIKVVSSKVGNYEFTEITDVTDFITGKNTINSLKSFDFSTGLMTKQTFTAKVAETAAQNTGQNTGIYGIIHITINGADKLSSFAGVHNADEVLSKAAAIVKRYENPHNTFAGRTSTNDFSILVKDTYDEGCRKLAEKIMNDIKEMVSTLPGQSSSIAKIYCGYALASGTSNASDLIAQADFAVFDAESRKLQSAVLFNPDNYTQKAQQFRKNQVFETIIDEDRIDYHFQPIVNARTGEIYGYEALMRPQAVDGIKLSPLDVLDIAKELDMLYWIEHITFWKTLRILSENQDFFHNRKLFINCIPNALLGDEEYEEFAEKYGMFFDRLVVEVTEENPVFDSAVATINRRFRNRKAQIALDDYGTGYSNDSTLLSVKPSCIKIDRSIMSGIDKDIQKQHLVANMINFAAQHEIMVLGEGIETFEELETAIALGIDLIQGYVACRPTAVLMLEIPSEIKNRILSYNIKHRGKVSKTYVINEHENADLVELSVAGFNEIKINSDSARIIGNPDIQVDMKIQIECKHAFARIKFENLSLICSEDNGCSVSVGNGTKANIEFVGRNVFQNGGIRVPEDAELFVSGTGRLEISGTRVYSYGIGGNYMQRYGRITFGGENNIRIACSGDSVVGIGGAEGGSDSAITANSGKIDLTVEGKDIVGVGSFAGDSTIKLNGCDFKVTMGGDNVVGVGARVGKASIDSLANLDINISGNNCCAVGVLEKGEGSIVINGSNVNILTRGKNIVGIGTIGGNIETDVNAGTVNIRCEGDNATGIGDASGGGNVRLRGAAVNAVTKASAETPIGTRDGKVYVTSGSVVTSDVEPLECYSLNGERLVRAETDGKAGFRRSVRSGGESYMYVADKTGEDIMYIYLPEAEAKLI